MIGHIKIKKIININGDLNIMANFSKLHIDRIIRESLENVINEAKFKTWEPDEFVNWEEYQDFCNHSYDWVEKNWERCERMGIPKDQRCDVCQRALKKGYVTFYCSNAPNGVSEFYAYPGPNREPVKIGTTCLKAFEKAHTEKYGR